MKLPNLTSCFKWCIIVIGSSIAIANTLVLARFLMWVSKTEDLCSVKFDFSSYLAVQSYQNSLFQSYMFAFSILIALAAWWGYATIKQGAENRAAEVARQASDTVLKKYIEQLEEHQKAFAVASKAFGSIGFMPRKEEIKEMKATTSSDAGKR